MINKGSIVLLKYIKKFQYKYILFRNYKHQNLSTSNFGKAKVYNAYREIFFGSKTSRKKVQKIFISFFIDIEWKSKDKELNK